MFNPQVLIINLGLQLVHTIVSPLSDEIIVVPLLQLLLYRLRYACASLHYAHLDSNLRSEPEVSGKHLVELHRLVEAGVRRAPLVLGLLLTAHESHLGSEKNTEYQAKYTS